MHVTASAAARADLLFSLPFLSRLQAIVCSNGFAAIQLLILLNLSLSVSTTQSTRLNKRGVQSVASQSFTHTECCCWALLKQSASPLLIHTHTSLCRLGQRARNPFCFIQWLSLTSEVTEVFVLVFTLHLNGTRSFLKQTDSVRQEFALLLGENLSDWTPDQTRPEQRTHLGLTSTDDVDDDQVPVMPVLTDLGSYKT